MDDRYFYRSLDLIDRHAGGKGGMRLVGHVSEGFVHGSQDGNPARPPRQLSSSPGKGTVPVYQHEGTGYFAAHAIDKSSQDRHTVVWSPNKVGPIHPKGTSHKDGHDVVAVGDSTDGPIVPVYASDREDGFGIPDDADLNWYRNARSHKSPVFGRASGWTQKKNPLVAFASKAHAHFMKGVQ
jgi:hypothetical protein